MNKRGRLTRIFGVLGADIFVTGVENVLVHKRGTRSHLTEEADFDWLTDLDTLALLDKDLTGILASVSAVQTGYSVLLGVVSLLEWLKGGHEVVSTSHTVGDNSLSDTGSNSTFDDGGYRVHRANNLGLILGRHVKLDLLEEVLGGTESTDNKNILGNEVNTR